MLSARCRQTPCSPATGCSTPGEWSRPYDGDLPGTAPDTVSVTIVRDAKTGAPLAGVQVRQYLETIDPRSPRAPSVIPGGGVQIPLNALAGIVEVPQKHSRLGQIHIGGKTGIVILV